MKVLTWCGSNVNFNFCPETAHKTFELILHLFYLLLCCSGWKHVGEGLPPGDGSYHSGKL